MSSRPSEPLLRLIREMAQKKGMNTAALARAANLDRTRLKHLLAGSQPLLVDELIALSQALELQPAELGGLSVPAEEPEPEEEEDSGPGLVALPLRRGGAARKMEPEIDDSIFKIEPLGNHAEQSLRLGFGLGVDLFLLLDTAHLGESGIPKDVLQRYPKELPLRLDAAYHRHNNPQWSDAHLEVNLSFDTLYSVKLPWAAFKQITYLPLPPEPVQPKPVEPAPKAPPPPGPRRGHLRLVE